MGNGGSVRDTSRADRYSRDYAFTCKVGKFDTERFLLDAHECRSKGGYAKRMECYQGMSEKNYCKEPPGHFYIIEDDKIMFLYESSAAGGISAGEDKSRSSYPNGGREHNHQKSSSKLFNSGRSEFLLTSDKFDAYLNE